jgi:uncharacterized coiled-coil protein SlyX
MELEEYYGERLLHLNAKTQLQNLSSMYTNLRSDYDATIHIIHTMRAITERNVSQLHDLRDSSSGENHSSVLVKLSRDLNEAAMNRSMLAQRIEDTSNLVASQRQIIDGLRSNVTEVQDSVTGLHGKLTTNIKNINNRINDHVDQVQHNMDELCHKRSLTTIAECVLFDGSWQVTQFVL